RKTHSRRRRVAMSHVSRYNVLSISALLALGVSSPTMAQDLQLAAPSVNLRAAIQNLPPTIGVVASRQTALQPSIVFPFPRHSRVARRAIVGLATLGGMVAGTYLGTHIENRYFPCHCDDPGLKGFLIGAPAGAIAAGVVAYRLTR